MPLLILTAVWGRDVHSPEPIKGMDALEKNPEVFPCPYRISVVTATGRRAMKPMNMFSISVRMVEPAW